MSHWKYLLKDSNVFGTRVLDKENYKFDEGNENAKEVKASKTVENSIFDRALKQIETENDQAPTATDDDATTA